MRIIVFIEDYKVVKKILDYLGIYEFKRDRPPPRVLAFTDTFDDWHCDDYVDFEKNPVELEIFHLILC